MPSIDINMLAASTVKAFLFIKAVSHPSRKSSYKLTYFKTLRLQEMKRNAFLLLGGNNSCLYNGGICEYNRHRKIQGMRRLRNE
jgi:hypothetical protein